MKRSMAVYEFHVSRRARDQYGFDQSLFTTTGNVIIANLNAARIFAQKINEQRDLRSRPEMAVQAGQISAMGLIDEILHHLIAEYRRRTNPRVMEIALNDLEARLGRSSVDATLRRFVTEFPPLAVYRGQLSADEYLRSFSTHPGGEPVANREIALEEMLLLWLENENPAFSPFLELFDDADLERETAYFRVFQDLQDFFKSQPGFGPGRQNLIDVLLTPARTHPDSLAAQLELLSQTWGDVISFIQLRMQTSLDTIREEQKPVFSGDGGPGGGGPALVYDFSGEEYIYEPERFSTDLDWMPNLVLMAKNTYVWLDQLARKYQRPIYRLDQVPDEELAMLRRWGVTGLWLIGLWERSPASQRIKQLRGNPNAVASAYSLFSYDIAADLGGEEAYQRLREQAWKRGIRLASDMVPNHMGIDSRWVIEHPDWFLQLPYSPFPTYSFNGPNLSWDERVGLFLEDHYYDNTDAGVVFKRVDFWTGDERYIYHGNDGTSIPWNDTAQLNYLLSEVREAVTQTILHVARKFPIIRFDAAMTLAKRHYARLWFPEPGSGGAIPSRAEQSLTKAQFDEAFPEEFWRTLVDRVAVEAPDTLLLAEAFWMMEGYFVRTLGMHRVYNSAFMNMLRDEKNQEYRLTIKNTLEFDPEILKRYVNFMNNPDERTAVDQFGKGDKYFGVSVMLATLPGLPMIGHGQVEGFGEKYGMEFRFPLWHEQPDVDLVARHEAEIFPLLRRRYLFAEAQDFRLYDFFDQDGGVNEDVFAYSNRAGDELGLVIYQNRFAEARGWINVSAAYAVKTGSGDEKILVQQSLGDALGLRDDPGAHVIFRDHITGLEYIRNSREILRKGLYLELHAYEYRVYLGFRKVQDSPEQPYARLAWDLGGRGVPDIDEALREMALAPLLAAFRDFVSPGMLDLLVQNRLEAETYEPANFRMALDEVERKAHAFLEVLVGEGYAKANEPTTAGAGLNATAIPDEGAASPAEESAQSSVEADLVQALSKTIRNRVETVLSLSAIERGRTRPTDAQHLAVAYLLDGPGASAPLRLGELQTWAGLLSWAWIAPLGLVGEPLDSPDPDAAARRSRAWLDELLLGKSLAEMLAARGVERGAARRASARVALLIGHENRYDLHAEPLEAAQAMLRAWLADEPTRRYLQVHLYDGVEWFNKEVFEELVWWSFAWQAAGLCAEFKQAAALAEHLLAAHRVVLGLIAAEDRSGYRVDRLLA